MIHVEVKTIHWNGVQCSNEHCKRLPEYIHYTNSNYMQAGGGFRQDWFIKPGTIVAWVGNGADNIYCRDCIDQVYQLLKSKLDSKLWVFG